MSSKKLGGFLGKLWSQGKEKSPALLAGYACVGVALAVYTMYKAAPKADAIIKDKQKKMKGLTPEQKEEKSKLVKETVVEVAPILAPPILLGVTTIAAVIGSQSINSRRIAAITALYNVANDGVRELNKKMEAVVGKEKAKEIKDAISKDRLDKSPKQSPETVIITGSGNCLCKDLYSGVEWRADPGKVREAIMAASAQCLKENMIEANDLYDHLQIHQRPCGKDMGWNSDDLVDGLLPIHLSTQLCDNGEPMLCLDFEDTIHPVSWKVYG